MTKSDKLPTIGNASMSAGVSKEAFQKRIKYAIKSAKLSDIRQKLGIEPDTPTGLRDAFTPELSALLSASGFDIPTVFPTEEPDTRLPSYPNPPKPPTKKTDTPEVKPDTNPTTKPDAPETRQPEPDKKPDNRTIIDAVFGTDFVLLLAVAVLIGSDGYCFGLLASDAIQSDFAFLLFVVVGITVGFAGIRNSYVLSRKERKAWETDYTGYWIFAFSTFQYLLHGSAFNLFSGWDVLTWSEIIGRNLLSLATPMATAAICVTIFKHSK